MSSKECETQLNELLEAWDLDEATLNQTDIEAIKHLLLENQMQQDVIIRYKTTNLDQAVDIQQLEQENEQLKDKLKGVQEERDYLFNKTSVENKYLQQERDKYKEVIEEVREHIEKNLSFCENDSQGAYEVCAIRIASDKKLLQILDTATKENK